MPPCLSKSEQYQCKIAWLTTSQIVLNPWNLSRFIVFRNYRFPFIVLTLKKLLDSHRYQIVF
jgi:hypothetical protein